MSEIPALDASLEFWENLELVALVGVFLGVLGEAVEEFTSCPESIRKRVGRAATYLLIAALAFEVVTTLRTMSLSGRLVEAERGARLALAEEIAPRTLSRLQWKTSVANLKRPGRTIVDIQVASTDAETLRFAVQLIRLMREADWAVPDEPSVLMAPGVRLGLFLASHNSNGEVAVRLLSDVLRANGIQFTGLVPPETFSGSAKSGRWLNNPDLMIVVGIKPLPNE